MSCDKCNEKYLLENSFGIIYFISEFQELRDKTIILLKELNIENQNKNGLVSIITQDTKSFFSENLNKIQTYFNQKEMNDIKIYISNNETEFDFQSALSAKPMQLYINLFKDKDFFDILNTESLTSHFQAIIDIKKNKIFGYETLIRGVKDDGSLIYPNILFDASRRNDMNFKLDKLCRESSLKTAAAKKISKYIFINFLPTSIYDPEFCLNTTVKWANQLDFDPSKIVFEVVETEKIEDQEHLKNILQFYRDKGFKIALDDVGEGYSNLNMLIELRPDIIKIDRKIITDISSNTLKQSVYKALYTIAKEHGITVLAEGVETLEELETVKSLGVDLVQGYYFAKPTAEPIRKINKDILFS
ncbi:MAG: EAL domain-containing protein [Arcobacter sp.]|nr:MAG: EAL domain-containing protein [Arcobacter sp.]